MRLVVAAVIRRGDGRFLLARRRPGSHLAGLWEFPGGGVEVGEIAESALERELAEELGIVVAVGRPVTFAWHRDEACEVLLLFYEATIAAGDPRGLEGQEVAWFLPGEMSRLPMPPADSGIVALIGAAQSGMSPA